MSTETKNESLSLKEHLVRETKEDLSNASFGPEAWVRTSIEALLGLALMIRILRDTLAYSLSRGEPPDSTEWSFVRGSAPQLPEAERGQLSARTSLNARVATAVVFSPLMAVFTVSPSILSGVVMANWLVLVFDAVLAFNHKGGNNNG